MSGQLIAAGGPWAFALSLAAAVITALMRGWLVPRGTLRDQRELLTERISDLKDTVALLQRTQEIQAKQLDEILDAIKGGVARAVP